MSYCRWSSMNWRCDVYVYEDCSGGWTTHVAGKRRRIQPIPNLPIDLLPRLGGEWDENTHKVRYPSRWHWLAAKIIYGFATFWYNRVHMASLKLIPLRPIGLPNDGECFNDPTPGECAARLEQLRVAGYIVPQRAIDALREEANDE